MSESHKSASTPPGLLSPDEIRRWRGFLAWTESVTSNVGRDLTAATELSPADFEILVRLAEAPGHAIEQRALTEALNWSASRISHQLARMVARGYLTKEEVGIGRLMQIHITPDGLQKITASMVVHAAAVRTHLLERISPALFDELLRDHRVD